MRSTLALLFVVTLLSLPLVTLGDSAFEQEERTETAAGRVGTAFAWPDRPDAAEPEVALRILTEAAGTAGVNVLRTSVNTTASGRKRITHYVLMGSDRTALFDGFSPAEGRLLDRADSLTGTATVSSVRTEDPTTVGVVEVFGSRYDLTFAPLRRAFDSVPVAGRYFVESPDGSAVDRFRDLVHRRLVESGARNLTADDFHAPGAGDPDRSDRRLKILAYLLTGLAALLAAFLFLREGKRIGVLRLLGHSPVRIWYLVAGRLQIASVLIGLAACAAVPLVVPGGSALVPSALVALAEVAATGLATTVVIGLVVVSRVQVADLIKGRLQ